MSIASNSEKKILFKNYFSNNENQCCFHEGSFFSSFWRKMNRRRKRNIAFEIRATLIANLIFPSNVEDIEREKNVSS